MANNVYPLLYKVSLVVRVACVFSFCARWRLRVQTWWQSLQPQYQQGVVSLLALLAVLMFVAAVVSSLVYLRVQEVAREQQALERDIDYSAQRFRARLDEHQQILQRLARQMQEQGLAVQAFDAAGDVLTQANPEIHALLWLDAGNRLVARRYGVVSASQHVTEAEQDVVEAAVHARLPAYALVRQPDGSEPYLVLAVPLVQGDVHIGALLVRYALGSLMYQGIPSDTFSRYAVSLVHATTGEVLAGQGTGVATANNLAGWSRWLQLNPVRPVIQIPLPPVTQDVLLHLHGYGSGTTLVDNGLKLLVLALAAVSACALLLNWRHVRRRQLAQQALQTEASFRRAMENSLVTGMRALDMDSRIQYVNAAFVQMTGWSEAELLGQIPPYNFWHPEDYERNLRVMHMAMEQARAGGASRTGVEMRALRKDGSTFEARMYMAPLAGADGVQTGWVTSMTDITEPNRIKRQLTLAQARFVRVLDTIDASVSVAPLGVQELLFANRTYRQWFGEDAAASHLNLLAQACTAASLSDSSEADADPLVGLPGDSWQDAGAAGNSEIYLPALGRWLEVRSRYLEWVDGRLAQMVVATDITARHHAEELSAQHEARAQAASRLVTMGEMASSVAHELNQPLTAIENYCSGMMNRLRNGHIEQDALLGALEKTARQAQRAGQIIQRIRSFVKRSAPNRTSTEVAVMVAEALELADIEMRRRNVRLYHQIAGALPPLLVDRILIEQVLVNLMKNAAEAIDVANMPPPRREVLLEVGRQVQAGQDVVLFSITDRGNGLSPQGLEHLFEAFYTTKPEGLGIGLNLCRSIVEAHQGRLHAENLYNESQIQGCRFYFWLPVPQMGAIQPS